MDLPRKNIPVLVIGLLTITGGLTVMAGWLCHVVVLQKMIFGLAGVRFNAGLCFVLFGTALLLANYNHSKYGRWLCFLLSFVGASIGFITLCQYIFKFNTGLDQLFFTDETPVSPGDPFQGRMAFNAALNFSLLGVASLIFHLKKPFFRIIAQYIFHCVTVLSGIALIGFLFGVSLFRILLYVTAMPIPTATWFFMLSIGASLLNPTLGITKIFTGKLVGNQLARRLFSLVLLMIFISATLRDETKYSSIFSSLDIWMSVLAVCFLLLSLLLIWNTAIWLNKIDAKRYEAEERIKTMNAGLEKMVEERSAELKEAELKFRTIAEKSMVGVYIVQGDTFTYVNPRFAEIFGLKPGELIGFSHPSEKIFHESYRAIVVENVRQRLEGEVESLHYEAIGKRNDGTNNWVEIYGNAVTIGGKPAIIGSMIDITERKLAGEELRSSELKYKLLFESNPMPMWMIDKESLHIIAANDAASKLYGYTKDELLQMDVKSLRPKEDKEQQIEGYAKDMDGVPRIARHLKKDGTLMFVQMISHDIVFEGRPVRLSLTNDVTEKLKAEELLQKSEANLQAILKTTDTAYALFDRKLKVLASNQKAAEFISEQYSHPTETTHSIADYFPEHKFPELGNIVNEVLKGSNINFEVDFAKTDGAVSWYYVRLFPITNGHKAILGILMALYDITERKTAEHDLKTAYSRIQSHINNIKDMAWKQSHLIRSPLANLKGLTALLKGDITDQQVIDHIHTELNRMDAIIIEMADDVADEYSND